jgi:NarL family two-component system response regulator LiaR
MDTKNLIRVILIDDHSQIHQAVSSVLDTVTDIQLIAHGSNGDEAVLLCDEYQPDLVLMDVVMPIKSGVEATGLIHQKYPNIKILVMSSFQDDESVHAMLANGAIGYVLKSSLAHDLVTTIRAAYYGKSVFSAEVTRILLKPAKSESGTNFGLTVREIVILKLMSDGLNNGEIAGKLVISRSTVKFHLNNILRKMKVETRSEAIVLAAKNGLV